MKRTLLLCTLIIASAFTAVAQDPGGSGIPPSVSCGIVEPIPAAHAATPVILPDIGALFVNVDLNKRYINVKFVSFMTEPVIQYGARYTVLDNNKVHQLLDPCGPLPYGAQVQVMDGKYHRPLWGERYLVRFYVRTKSGTRSVSTLVDMSRQQVPPQPPTQPGSGPTVISGNFPVEPIVYAEGVGPVDRGKVSSSRTTVAIYADLTKAASLTLCVGGTCTTYPIKR